MYQQTATLSLDLRPKLKPEDGLSTMSNTLFLSSFIEPHATIIGVSSSTIVSPKFPPSYGGEDFATRLCDLYPGMGLTFQAAKGAHEFHYPISLTPEVCWIIVLNEVKIAIERQEAREAQKWRNSIPRFLGLKKQKARITAEHYGEVQSFQDVDPIVRQLMIQLRRSLGDEYMELLSPGFSQSSPEVERAMEMTYLNMFSSRYHYVACQALCGIPRMEIFGLTSDWEALRVAVRRIPRLLPELRGYAEGLERIFEKIVDATKNGGGDENFWREFYRKSNSCGGDGIDGWLSSFVAYDRHQEGPRLRWATDWHKSKYGVDVSCLPSQVSIFNLANETARGVETLQIFGGVIGVEYLGALAPQPGFGVARIGS